MAASLDEVPDGMHLCGSWYALPTTDQDAVLEASGLGVGEPVTVRTGAAGRNRHNSSRRSHDVCARVFVSPVLV